MDDYIQIEDVKYHNGSITVIGKTSDGKNATFTCDATDLCQYTLKPNNKDGKTIVITELFKLSDIPNVMRKKGWAKAAYLNQRWLNGKGLAMLPSEKGEWSTSNPKLDYYEPTMFNHEWLSQFDRYNDAIIKLCNNITTVNAQKKLFKYLKREEVFSSSNFKNDLTSYSANSDYRSIDNAKKIKSFHNNWQFQFQRINSTFNEQVGTYIKNRFELDDLWAAFGSFAIYAGVGDYKIVESADKNYFIVTLESIVCYAVDSYDFIVKTGNDYLGHWNKNDVHCHPFNPKIRGLNYSYYHGASKPIGNFNPNNLTYPVFNSHYEAYRKKLAKGRDMVIWSKPHVLDLKKMVNNRKIHASKISFVINKNKLTSL